MAVVEFECTVCRRNLERVRDPSGMEVLLRCEITKNCMGNLVVVGVNETQLIPKHTVRDANLLEFIPRNVLFKYTQHVSSTQWHITHNLNNSVIVNVFLGDELVGYQNISPSGVVILSSNELILEFDAAISGTVDILASSSKPHTTTVITNQSATTLTNDNSIMTLATAVDSQSVSIELEFTNADGVSYNHTYIIDNTPIDTAWVDRPTIIFHNQRMTVRTLDVMEFTSLLDGSVFDGARVELIAVDGVPVSEGDALALLSTPPHATPDKVRDKFVDLYSVEVLTYQQRGISTYDVQKVFPLI